VHQGDAPAKSSLFISLPHSGGTAVYGLASEGALRTRGSARASARASREEGTHTQHTHTHNHNNNTQTNTRTTPTTNTHHHTTNNTHKGARGAGGCGLRLKIVALSMHVNIIQQLLVVSWASQLCKHQRASRTEEKHTHTTHTGARKAEDCVARTTACEDCMMAFIIDICTLQLYSATVVPSTCNFRNEGKLSNSNC